MSHTACFRSREVTETLSKVDDFGIEKKEEKEVVDNVDEYDTLSLR